MSDDQVQKDDLDFGLSDFNCGCVAISDASNAPSIAGFFNGPFGTIQDTKAPTKGLLAALADDTLIMFEDRHSLASALTASAIAAICIILLVLTNFGPSRPTSETMASAASTVRSAYSVGATISPTPGNN